MLKSLILGFLFFIVDKTNKWTFHNEEVLKNASESDSPVLICLWHGFFIFPLVYLKKNLQYITIFTFVTFRHESLTTTTEW